MNRCILKYALMIRCSSDLLFSLSQCLKSLVVLVEVAVSFGLLCLLLFVLFVFSCDSLCVFLGRFSQVQYSFMKHIY